MTASSTLSSSDTAENTAGYRSHVGRTLFFGVSFGLGIAMGINKTKGSAVDLEALLVGPEGAEMLPCVVFAGVSAFNERGSIECTVNPVGVPSRTYRQAIGDAFIGASFMYGAYKVLERAGYGVGLLISSL